MEGEKRTQVCEKLGWRGANNNLQREVREPQDRWESEITAFSNMAIFDPQKKIIKKKNHSPTTDQPNHPTGS